MVSLQSCFIGLPSLLLIPLVPSALGHGGVVFLGAPEETVQERVKKEI